MNAFEKWWKTLNLKGDSEKSSSLVRDAFYAGVAAGRKEMEDDTRAASIEERWKHTQGEDYGSY